MKNFKFAVVAMIIFGTLFGTGCGDLSNTFHETAGIVIPQIDPQILKPTNSATGSTEAELLASGTFPSTTVYFQNLNGIPVVIKAYKIDFYDTTDGSKIGNLTFSGQTVFTIPGSGATATGATTTGDATAATTGTTDTSSKVGLTLYLWTQNVKTAVYGSTSTATDNKQLLAKIDIYGEDYNGNSVAIQAAVTLTP